VAEAFIHQAQFARLGAIFTGPYITRLIRGMNLLDRARDMTIVGGVAPLSATILQASGLIEKRGNSYRLSRHPVEGGSSLPEESDSEHEDAPAPAPDFNARLRGMEGDISAIRHEQHEMRGQLFQILEGQCQLAEDFRQFTISARVSSSQTATTSCTATPAPPLSDD